MFGLGPIDLIIISGIALFMFVVPIVTIVLVVRLVVSKEKNDQQPRP